MCSSDLYIRPDWIPRLEPAEVGWMAQPATADFTRFLDYDPTLFDDARRFEVVTLDFVNFAAMAESLGLFLDVGARAAADAVRAHGDRTVAFCEAQRHVTLLTPADPAHRAGVLALRPRDLMAASQRLKDRGVYHSVREGHVRISPHFYTSAAELDRALEVVASA